MKAFNSAPEKLSAEIYLHTETLHKTLIMRAQNFIMKCIWGSIGNETAVPLQLMHFSSYILYWRNIYFIFQLMLKDASRMVLMCIKAGTIQEYKLRVKWSRACVSTYQEFPVQVSLLTYTKADPRNASIDS